MDLFKHPLSRSSSSGSLDGARADSTKTHIIINVYDLLPPGKISSFLWAIGTGMYHSGVVVNGREYAYGGHDRRGVSGVYYTRPKLVPPHATFRTTIAPGYTTRSDEEIDRVLEEAKDAFMGPSYNLLTKNCNHFTSYLCERLTGKPAPKWLNRAAGIGGALPCMVPRDWIEPPDYDTVDGELLDEEEDEDEDEDAFSEDERAQMLQDERRARRRKAIVLENESEASSADEVHAASSAEGAVGAMRARYADGEHPRPVLLDAGGREMPAAERAPLPHTHVRRP